jgi:phage-related minor tail protein
MAAEAATQASAEAEAAQTVAASATETATTALEETADVRGEIGTLRQELGSLAESVKNALDLLKEKPEGEPVTKVEVSATQPKPEGDTKPPATGSADSGESDRRRRHKFGRSRA